MPATVRSACPSCQTVVRLAAEHVGKRVRCPKCQAPFVAEAQPDPAPVKPAASQAEQPPIKPAAKQLEPAPAPPPEADNNVFARIAESGPTPKWAAERKRKKRNEEAGGEDEAPRPRKAKNRRRDDDDEPVRRKGDKETAKSSTTAILIACGAIVLIAGIALGVYVATSESGKKKGDGAEVAKQEPTTSRKETVVTRFNAGQTDNGSSTATEPTKKEKKEEPKVTRKEVSPPKKQDPAPPAETPPVVAKEPPAKKEPEPVANNGTIPGQVLDRVKAATVFIKVTLPGGKASGSGFFAHAPGMIVTNAHVVAGQKIGATVRKPLRIEAVLNSGQPNARTLPIRVVAVDDRNDLALLRVVGDDLPDPLQIADSAKLRETHEVFIFGFPFGEKLGQDMTVSKSTISALRRSDPTPKIQVNGGMHPGNSGGPVTDTAGQVIGVAQAGIIGTQINLAVPGEVAQKFCADNENAQGVDVAKVNPKGPVGNPNPNPNPNPNRPLAALDCQEVKLPGAADTVCLAANGRMLLLRLPSTKQLAVVDVKERKVVKYLPLPEAESKVAGGADKIFVYSPGANAIQRWNLATFEKELTVPSPVTGEVHHFLHGAGSNGPLYMSTGERFRSSPMVLDTKTFKPLQLKADNSYRAGWSKECYMRISGDGRLLTAWNPHLSPMSHTALELIGNEFKARGLEFQNLSGHASPAADGKLIHTPSGIFTAEGKPSLQRDKGGNRLDRYFYTLPAAEAVPFFLSIQSEGFPHGMDRDPAKLYLHLPGESASVATIDDVELPSKINVWDREPFGVDQRVHLIPSADALVVIPDSTDRCLVYKLNVLETIEKAGKDYLFVASTPPSEAAPGGMYEYEVVAKSSKGPVTVRLDAGPDGMKVDGNKVTWSPAKGWKDTESVILTVTDMGGREVFHSFKVGAGRPAATNPKDDPVVAIKPPEPKVEPEKKMPEVPPAKKESASGFPESVELKLPERVTDSAVGGGGRYWCLLLGDSKQIAVVDMQTGKVAKYIPTATPKAVIAAGRSKLLVADPDAETLARYNLATFEKEITAKLPFQGTVREMCMGSASDGPVLVSYTRANSPALAFVDVAKLKEVTFPQAQKGNEGGIIGDRLHFRAGPDGRTFGAWATGQSPSGLHSIVVTDAGPKFKYEHESVGTVVPTATGHLLTGSGLYTADLKSLDRNKGDRFVPGTPSVPAQQGDWYLSLVPNEGRNFNREQPVGTKVAVMRIGERTPVATLGDLGIELPSDYQFPREGLTLDKRVAFSPEHGRIGFVDHANLKVTIRRFDLEEALDASGVDYLFVASSPPRAEPGKPFRYAIAVKSKKGGVTYKLESGPTGMKVDADGNLTWNVPAKGAIAESVILLISDKSGQEVFHNFQLSAGKQ